MVEMTNPRNQPKLVYLEALLVFLVTFGNVDAFTCAKQKSTQLTLRVVGNDEIVTSSTHQDKTSSSTAPENLVSRRGWGMLVAFSTASVCCANTPFASAAGSATSAMEDDKAKIVQGYKRLNYLLDNWEKETTICGNFDNPYTGTKGCERTPLKVMDYLGYKSMKDPLFKADKTLRRLGQIVPADRQIDFLDVVEKYTETAEEGSGMAYVSSWGEANPGGGKDRVEYFIERAKNNVITARDCLADVIEILDIPID